MEWMAEGDDWSEARRRFPRGGHFPVASAMCPGVLAARGCSSISVRRPPDS